MSLSVLLVLVCACTCGVRGLDQALRDHVVRLHNDYRAGEGAADMNKIEWDDTLAASAARWAGGCWYAHSGGPGENLAYNSNKMSEKDLITSSMESWFSEKRMYSYSTSPCTNTCHYTQIVWAKTTKVGCATKVCAPLGNIGGWNDPTWWIVCQYDPKGNIGRKYPYVRGAACSKCGEGATCQAGLCSGGDDCVDINGSCGDWAGRGECDKNPAYMKTECCKSCKKGGSSGGGGDCADKNGSCASWASSGECTANPDWMKTNCCKSCKKGGASSGGGCRDSVAGCAAWARRGECNKNPAYMRKSCAKSCRQC